jgi:DNA-binding transcriptional LysR family regulator
VLKPIHLQTLAVVVRRGSFSAAGRQLGYTASAVAQQMAALERDLGLPLFTRGPQRVDPTPVALLLEERGRHVLDLLESLEEEARALAFGTDRLRIGSALDVGAGVIPEMLGVLRDAGPTTGIELHDGSGADVLDRVRLGTLDVGLVYDYPLAPRSLSAELEAIDLEEAPMQLATPARWLSGSRLDGLAGCDWYLGLDAPNGERAVRAMCGSAGFEPRIRATAASHDLVFGHVAAELGVGVVPTLPWRAPAGVTLRPLTDVGGLRRTVAVYLRRHAGREPLRVALRAARRATASRS